jgi:glycosyltransferase involved in cell wall biosynthesis
MNDITVSIFILTYNQEKFIAQTIESVLMQKTDFSYQLVIGEDCSNDKTRIICEKYACDNGDKIKLLPSPDRNTGLIKNYIRTIKECDGKYIAICDGDDYWIDENKLQKQVDYLDSHPDFSIVYCKVKELFPNGETKEPLDFERKQNAGFEDLIFDNFIPSVSVLFRNIQKESLFPNWIYKFPYGDWPTYLWTIYKGGKIFFLDEVTAVYRMNIGVSAQIRKINSDILQVNLSILDNIFHDINFANKKEIVSKVIIEKKIALMSSFNREKKYYKGFLQYIENLEHTKFYYQLTKMYLYSIYKSVV